MTNDQMTKRVQSYLGLQDIAVYDETSLVSQLIYEGTLDLLARTKCIARCVQLRVQKGQDEYTLDQGILALLDMENGARKRLRRDQSFSDSGVDATWYASPGQDTLSWNARGYTLIRSDLLIVKPTPDADGTIQIWGVMHPQKMTLPADSPSMESYGAIPEEFQDAIITYALWKAADYADDGGSQQGEYYRVLYEGQDGRGGRLGQIRAQVNKRGGAKFAPRGVRLRSTSGSGSYVG